ncbi:MAG TPA: hypothetical protein VMG41_02105 [Gemmatimonadales bacterium]|nr:hypothetical protein [Gemmatimonadales bacterium]
MPEPEEKPLRIVLTPEQREVVRRMSGQHVEAIELKPDDDRKQAGVLRFLWRLSAATGIPRQAWVTEDEDQRDKEKK